MFHKQLISEHNYAILLIIPIFSLFRLAYAAGSRRSPFTFFHMISLLLTPARDAYTPISTMSKKPQTHIRMYEEELSSDLPVPSFSHAVP